MQETKQPTSTAEKAATPSLTPGPPPRPAGPRTKGQQILDILKGCTEVQLEEVAHTLTSSPSWAARGLVHVLGATLAKE